MTKTPWLLLLIFIYASGFSAAGSASELATDDDWETWFEQDFEQKALSVNEGDLRFLPIPPAGKTTHRITTEIRIGEKSLRDAWVSFSQCHRNLDAVAVSQIVYEYPFMRNLRVQHSENIDKAWVADNTIQLDGVRRSATVCASAEVKLLNKINPGVYQLKNGPYFRNFLDGYYPLWVELIILYPAERLTLSSYGPRPGPTLNSAPGRISLSAWFEGKLTYTLWFAKKTPSM